MPEVGTTLLVVPSCDLGTIPSVVPSGPRTRTMPYVGTIVMPSVDPGPIPSILPSSPRQRTMPSVGTIPIIVPSLPLSPSAVPSSPAKSVGHQSIPPISHIVDQSSLSSKAEVWTPVKTHSKKEQLRCAIARSTQQFNSSKSCADFFESTKTPVETYIPMFSI
jgi:hypothetical protein